MGRRMVIAAALTLAVLGPGGPLAAQAETPLLDDPGNCSELQDAFGGAQPATPGVTVTVELATDCFLVVGLNAPAGEAIELTYLSGQFDAIDVAFYGPGAGPGNAFHNPANAELGIPTSSGQVPGVLGQQQVFVVLQGVGGPNPGTAAIRISAGEVVATTTTTTVATTTTTTATATTTATTTTTTSSGTAQPATTTAEPTTTTVEVEAATTSAAATSTAGTAEEGDASVVSAPSGNGVPGWVWILATGIAAALVFTLLLARLRAGRKPAPSPFHRSIVTWTLQHSPPSGTCSSNARAIVDPDDAGSLEGYEVSTIFALPATGKRVRTTIGDPMLGQLETLYLGGGSGPELRSAVDALVNSLCRHLDQKKVSPDSTLLAELTKSDVTLPGDAYACVDGEWRRFADWSDAPDLPAGGLQHDIIQVAVLWAGAAAGPRWLDRTEQLSSSITELIETRRAAGLWVFD